MSILAIDLGQDKSVFCVMNETTGQHRFGEVTDVIRSIGKVLEKYKPDTVVMEICPLAGAVQDVVLEQGYAVVVADTTQDAWQWKNVKRKTDRDDALKLAKLTALNQINPVYIPAPRMRSWRQLVDLRRTLVAEQTRCKNRIRALMVPLSITLPASKSCWSLSNIATLWSLSQPLKACDPDELWRGLLDVELQRLDSVAEMLREVEDKLNRFAKDDYRVKLVESIPGVGTRTAEVLVTAIDVAHRFKNRRQVSAYAGLTPRRYQSGKMDIQGRISKRGNPHIRQVLNQAAWASIRFCPEMRTMYMRLTDGGKRNRKKAIVAVMRKLMVLAWAILRDNRPYEPREERTPSAVRAA